MDLLRFKFGQKYLVWDAETVSLNLASHNIQGVQQWGWCVYQKNKQMDLLTLHEDVPYFDDLIPKMRKWGKEAAIITGFDENIYKSKGTDPVPILDAFNRYLLNPEILSITANGQNFDLYIYKLFNEFVGRKVEWSWVTRHIDIQVLHKAHALGWTPPSVGTPDWAFFCAKVSKERRKGLKSSLAFLCKEWNVPYDGTRHHREASYDSELTMAIFEKQIGMMDIYINK